MTDRKRVLPARPLDPRRIRHMERGMPVAYAEIRRNERGAWDLRIRGRRGVIVFENGIGPRGWQRLMEDAPAEVAAVRRVEAMGQTLAEWDWLEDDLWPVKGPEA